MPKVPDTTAKIDREYLAFVKKRMQTATFSAAEKLRYIDELTDIVVVARTNYRKKKRG